MQVGDKVLWQPDLSDLLHDVVFPTSLDLVVTLLEIDINHFEPMAHVEWRNGIKSWVRIRDLHEITLAT